jgi:hypothetical protein
MRELNLALALFEGHTVSARCQVHLFRVFHFVSFIVSFRPIGPFVVFVL